MPEPSNRVATPVSQAQSAPIIERTARIYELSKGTLIVRIPSFGIVLNLVSFIPANCAQAPLYPLAGSPTC